MDSIEALENNKTTEKEVSRRSLLGILGFIGFAVSGLFGTIINGLFLKPEVNYGPRTIFAAGRPEDYKVGTTQIFEDERVIVTKGKEGFAAISLTCTHLRCTVKQSALGFECPCHGSKFDEFGHVTSGPAPVNLPWFKVSISPSGDVEIDKTIKVDSGKYFVA